MGAVRAGLRPDAGLVQAGHGPRQRTRRADPRAHPRELSLLSASAGAVARRPGNRSACLGETRPVPGLEVRVHDALGDLQPVGLHRVVAAGGSGPVGPAGRSARLDRAGQGLSAVLPRLRGPEQDLQSAEVRPKQMGRRGPGRRHEVRRLHDEAPRRLLHVRHAPDRLPHDASLVSLPHESEGRRRQAGLRDVPSRGLWHRSLLLEIRLESSGLLGPRLAAQGPQRQLRHQKIPREVGDIRQFHAQHREGADDRLRPGGHPLAGRRPGPPAAAGYRHAQTGDDGPQSPAGPDRRGPHGRRSI